MLSKDFCAQYLGNPREGTMGFETDAFRVTLAGTDQLVVCNDIEGIPRRLVFALDNDVQPRTYLPIGAKRREVVIPIHVGAGRGACASPRGMRFFQARRRALRDIGRRRALVAILIAILWRVRGTSWIL